MLLLVKQGGLSESKCFSVSSIWSGSRAIGHHWMQNWFMRRVQLMNWKRKESLEALEGLVSVFGQCSTRLWLEGSDVDHFLIVLSITRSPGRNSSSNFTPEPEAQHEDCRWVARISKSKIPLAKWLGPSVCSFRNGRYLKETHVSCKICDTWEYLKNCDLETPQN